MNEFAIDELDIVFISYDEPLKDENWTKLSAQVPFAKRVDNVTGFDAAHKQAASIAETDRFITIDGDTQVNDSFFDKMLRFDDKYKDFVFSWAGTNIMNGLVYGNGSIKCWTRDAVMKMNTHENADNDTASIEFCWSIPYLSMSDSYSTTNPAATPYHAFRAGMREGVKMALSEGQRVTPTRGMFDRLWRGNRDRLLVWASIGADHENGLWAIYGARMGLNLICDPEWDLSQVADYHWFEQYWNTIISEHQSFITNGEDRRLCKYSGTEWSPRVLLRTIDTLGDSIYRETGMYIPVYPAELSRFHKTITSEPVRPTEVVLF